ncbi:hypothetical protein PCI56_20275 [Plesiomonas shigelloides subsp. oncorhynchi]|nr:hypothetical protein [Plesiomonas shigelloides]
MAKRKGAETVTLSACTIKQVRKPAMKLIETRKRRIFHPQPAIRVVCVLKKVNFYAI